MTVFAPSNAVRRSFSQYVFLTCVQHQWHHDRTSMTICFIGECICDDVNWSGALCNRCSETFYGRSCLPLMKVLQVAPVTGPDVGGTVVQVFGHNFRNSTEYLCR